MKKHEETDDAREAVEAGPGLDHDDHPDADGAAPVLGAAIVVGVADRPSGIRRIAGGLSKRFGKGKEPLEPLPPGAHWNVGDGSADALDRAGVLSLGCFYARLEGYNRWRCFNRLTGFEHVTYHNRGELEIALLDQSAKWAEKLMPASGARTSPWASGWAKGQKAKAS